MTENRFNSPLVRTERCGRVLNVVLDAPAQGNAMTVAMTEQLADVLEEAAALSEDVEGVHCLVLRSSGKHFCTGGNVKDMREGTDLMAGSVADVRSRLQNTLHRLTRALATIEIPTIAEVNGLAIGAGCDLALMCDIRIAGEQARFAESFLRLGLVSGIGGAWFLTRLVGPAKAMEMTLTSEFMDAHGALAHGIVSRVVPQQELASETAKLAAKVASAPPLALRMAKRLVRESARSELSTALEMAASMQAILLCGDEHKATVTEFLASLR